MKEIQVGLLGLGTVGSGVVRIITDHQERLIHHGNCKWNDKFYFDENVR
ncbi:hypothetical protein [Bacillus toyonensis]